MKILLYVFNNIHFFSYHPRYKHDVGYVPNNVVPKVFMAVACDLRDDPNV